MESYQGIEGDLPVNGGSHPDRDKHEVYNFKDFGGYCYGYVQPQGECINLSRVFPEYKAGASVEDVLVVWVATAPDTLDGYSGSYIVGWYQSAEVKASQEKGPSGRLYNIRAKSDNVYLVPQKERTFSIPQGRKAQSPWKFGQCNLRYIYSERGEIELPQEIENEMLHYIYASQCVADEVEAVSVIYKEGLLALGYKGCGEGSEHKALKEYVRMHPELVGAAPNEIGTAEFKLASGDILDVYFKQSKIAVEVKSRISNDDDVKRGLFQCVKYKAVLDAEDKVAGREPERKVVLVLERRMADEHKDIRAHLGLKVIDGVQPK